MQDDSEDACKWWRVAEFSSVGWERWRQAETCRRERGSKDDDTSEVMRRDWLSKRLIGFTVRKWRPLRPTRGALKSGLTKLRKLPRHSTGLRFR